MQQSLENKYLLGCERSVGYIKITHEETTTIKMSKIQWSEKDFESLTMEDDEFVDDFYGDTVNTSFNA